MTRSAGGLFLLMTLCGSGCDGPTSFNGAIPLTELPRGTYGVFDVLKAGGRGELVGPGGPTMLPPECPTFMEPFGVAERLAIKAGMSDLTCDYAITLSSAPPLSATGVGLIVATDPLGNDSKATITLRFSDATALGCTTPQTPGEPLFLLHHEAEKSSFSSSRPTFLSSKICMNIQITRKNPGSVYISAWHITDLRVVYTTPAGQTP